MATRLEADERAADRSADDLLRRWWRGEAGWWGTALNLALGPAELAYRVGLRYVELSYAAGWRTAQRVALPIISVGNLSVGGTGKTPFVRWAVDRLLERGANPAVSHGGYGMDEPELHRRWHPGVPVLVGRDRSAAARAAREAGAGVLVLDDGFQHRRTARDLDIVLVAAERWTSKPRLLPRGPWREAPAALARADVVVVTRKIATTEAASAVAAEAGGYAPGAAVSVVALPPGGWRHVTESSAAPVSRDPPEGPTLAVCAIAEPDTFVRQARAAGAAVAGLIAFRDHHAYTVEDVARITRRAAGRPVVTTAKDAVKLGRLATEVDLRVLEQTLVVETGAAELERELERVL